MEIGNWKPETCVSRFQFRFSLIALALGFLIIVQNPAYGKEARLSNIIITNTRDDLLIYLTVEGAFREDMKKAILSGVPTTFSFIISLYKSRNYWFDKTTADITVTHTIKYHNLKKEYVITRSWENDKPIVVKSFNEAKKLMCEVENLKVIPLSKLEKDGKYQIRAKAELNTFTLPYYLHYILFFVSLWDFETDWYTIDFVY